jgi:hypothetical protein
MTRRGVTLFKCINIYMLNVRHYSFFVINHAKVIIKTMKRKKMTVGYNTNLYFYAFLFITNCAELDFVLMKSFFLSFHYSTMSSRLY